MIALKKMLPILLAILMLFAMMPMTAETVFAIDADVTPPEIDISSLKVTLPEGKTEVTVGDSVTVSVKITDTNDISYVYISYAYPGKMQTQTYDPKYNTETESYEMTIPITEDVPSGVCKIFNISARDRKDNYVELNNIEAVETLYPDIPAAFFQPQADLSAGDFTVYGTSADVAPPEIDTSSLKVTLPEGKTEVTVGDSVTVSVKITDTNDISYVYISYAYPGKMQTQTYDPKYNTETESYELTIPITEDVPYGVCKIFNISARDRKDNYMELNNIDAVETLYPDIPAAFFQPQADLSAGDFTVVSPDEEVTLTIGVYDKTESACGEGGTYTFNDEDRTHTADKFTVAKGSSVQLVAAPAEGYEFVGWCEGKITGDTDELRIEPAGEIGTSNPVGKFSANKDVILCAVFKAVDGMPNDPCANGHTIDSWTTKTPATEIAAGVRIGICSVCGKTETQAIAMLSPTLKAVKILKPKAAKKSATIKWKKISKKDLKKIKKVEIQYSTDKNFKNDVKSKYPSAKKTSYKIKGLKKGKKYYVHIRAYTKSGGVVHVSKWSAQKPVKVK